MRRVLDRDAGAFDVLFARHSRAVRNRLTRIVRSDPAGDDLLQEVFLRVWTRADQWAGQGSVRGWLLAIATNLALNHLRSARRHRGRPLRAPSAPAREAEDDLVPGWMVDASVPGPDAAAELAEREQMFRRLIGELPGDKREVMRMAYEEQMDIGQIAAELGIPPGTVKSRLFYGRRMLRQSWQDIEPQREDT